MTANRPAHDQPVCQQPAHQQYEQEARAQAYRANSPAFADWAQGYGVIRHTPLTQVRVHDMAVWLTENGAASKPDEIYTRLKAADRLANAAMWLTAHMTYADSVYMDGRALRQEDFKPDPQGHTGGALNIAVAYVGYMAANALCGTTRSWMMGQGHCVAAIDAVNLLLDNMSPEQTERYGLSDEGMTQLVRDFYSYAISPDGHAAVPLGSHVNPNTGGGVIEGGYLGFAELLYPHMPLPGERLVAFLSDGAFEEQRGSDWASRWWRAEDCGFVAPIMIANGRRIDQRSTMAQSGGVDWFRDHLALNGFDPIDIDGRDPAAFAWVIFEIEERLRACGDACKDGRAHYPVPLHYAIAETEKGFGFPGAGTNAAHNLPLDGNPSKDEKALAQFNNGAAKLYVPEDMLRGAIEALQTHGLQNRIKERDHTIAMRQVKKPALPSPDWREPGPSLASPMDAVDSYFAETVKANPHLRPRVGNPDEMRSNRLNKTLDLLKHRVTAPEEGIAEAVDGSVITALNEEAIVCAALGNKGGINLVCSYEAFAVKMLGALRQDLIFARNRKQAGQKPQWLGVPIVLTSHTWENGKNEHSHQDPTLCEAMMAEMTDVSRVAFPCDWNSAQAVLRETYRTRATIWSIVVPKRGQPNAMTADAAEALIRDGAVRLAGTGDEPLILTATGAYQLQAVLRASARLHERGIDHMVNYLLEPGRFRSPRDRMEAGVMAPIDVRERLFPDSAQSRIFLTHCRPGAFLGTIRPLDTGPDSTFVLGYSNRGGTLDEQGMLFANGCTWAHALAHAASAIKTDPAKLLSAEELEAIALRGDPAVLR